MQESYKISRPLDISKLRDFGIQIQIRDNGMTVLIKDIDEFTFSQMEAKYDWLTDLLLKDSFFLERGKFCLYARRGDDTNQIISFSHHACESKLFALYMHMILDEMGYQLCNSTYRLKCHNEFYEFCAEKFRLVSNVNYFDFRWGFHMNNDNQDYLFAYAFESDEIKRMEIMERYWAEVGAGKFEEFASLFLEEEDFFDF